MSAQHDLIALYRHALRAGDVALSRQLGRALVRDPRYRARALAQLSLLPFGAERHDSPQGALLDDLLDVIDPRGAPS